MARIISNPEILGGKPIVEGTRLSVEHILGLLAHKMTPDEIVASYPELSEESIQCVLVYAAEALSTLDLGDALRAWSLQIYRELLKLRLIGVLL